MGLLAEGPALLGWSIPQRAASPAGPHPLVIRGPLCHRLTFLSRNFKKSWEHRGLSQYFQHWETTGLGLLQHSVRLPVRQTKTGHGWWFFKLMMTLILTYSLKQSCSRRWFGAFFFFLQLWVRRLNRSQLPGPHLPVSQGGKGLTR